MLSIGNHLLAKRFYSTPPASLTDSCRTKRLSETIFEGFITDTWSIGDAPNGGYLMMMAMDAATQSSDSHPDPLSFSALYLAKAEENTPATLTVRKISQSRSTTTLQVTMTQKDIVRSEYTGIFGNFDNMEGIDHTVKHAPILPAQPQHCLFASKGLRKALGDKLKIAFQTEMHIAPDSPSISGIFANKKGDRASITAYMGLVSGEIPTLASMAFYNDAMLPPVLNIAELGWVPTLQYTVHFWNRPPADQPLVRIKFETDFVRKSMLYTDAEIWSQDGSTLLSTSRQYARLMVPQMFNKKEKK